MNYLDFFGRRVSFPITGRIKGCNSILTSKSILASALGTTESNIVNFTIDNDSNEVLWHTKNTFVLRIDPFNNRGDALAISLRDTISEFESHKIVIGQHYRDFEGSNLQVLKNYATSSITNQGLENSANVTHFEMPLLTSIDDVGLDGLASNTPNGLIQDESFITGELAYIGPNGVKGAKIKYIRQNISITGQGGILGINPFTEIASVYPNLGGNNSQRSAFENCFLMPGHDYPNLITLGGYAAFKDNHSATYIRLANLRQVIFNWNGGKHNIGPFINCNSLIELDIRKCNNFPDPLTTWDGVPLTTPREFISGNNQNLTVHAHIDLKTSGNWNSTLGTDVHASLQKVINDGGTVNWYNEDGTFNSTNNN